MKAPELQEVMTTFDVFDNALLSHGYRPYMRDYELIVEVHVGPAEQGTYSYLFRFCVEVHINTALTDKQYRESLDDRLIVYESGKDLDGFLWGVNWSALYSGWMLERASERAANWTERIGIPFHEVRIEGNVHNMTLIFAELTVTKLSDRIDPGINSLLIPLR